MSWSESWHDYPTTYRKMFYDIRLRNGDVIERLWANAGDFHCARGFVYKSQQVVQIRQSKDQTFMLTATPANV